MDSRPKKVDAGERIHKGGHGVIGKKAQNRLIGVFCVFFVFCGFVLADGGECVIRAKRIYTAADRVINEGMIVVKGGKIIRVGKNLILPPGTKELRADVVIPGLVDIHSHTGVFTLPLSPENMDGNETTNPVTPEVRALDSFNFGDPNIRAGLAGGVTTIVSRPGSANVIGGTSMALKLKHAPPEQMILKEICDLKMTIEYNPVEFYGRKNLMPSTLMGVYFLAHKAFIEARDYMNDWEKYEEDKKAGRKAAPPKRDLGKEALVMALKREIPVHVHAITAAEIMSTIRLADEFNLRLCLAHIPCAYVIVDELSKRKDIHYNVGPTPLYTYYQNGLELKNSAAILAEAGLPVSFQADTIGEWQGNLLYLASLSVRYGMRKDDALKAITIRGAQAVGLDDRIGSIEEEKDADLVFLNNDPFEMATLVEGVMIDGKIEYRNEDHGAGGFQTSIPDAQESLTLPSGLETAERFAVRCGTLFTMAGPPVNSGVVLVDRGKIKTVGKGIAVPEGWPVVDAEDFVVMPGLVNPRSYVGIGFNWRRVISTDETSKPVVPEMEVKHAIDPQSPHFHYARQLGITTAMVTPGNKNVFGGRGAVIKTAGSMVDDMMIKNDAIMVMGLGHAVKRQGQMPMTRMGIAYLLRETMTRAREYLERKEHQEKGGAGDGSVIDFSMEAMLPVIKGEMPVMVHCERKDDILAAMRIADEFGLKLVLTGATDAYKVAEEIKKRDIPVILERVYRRKTLPDDEDFNPRNPVILREAGIRVAFRPEEGGQWNRPAVVWGGGDLLEIAALAVKYGMSEEAALRAVTIDAARIINMDQRVGSLEPGKDADMLILKGHPLRVGSLPQAVFIEGKLVYQKKKGEHTK